MTNEIIHVTFKDAGILLRTFAQSMPQPEDTYCKNVSKNIPPCCSYIRYHKKWFVGADISLCFFSYSRATDTARSFRLLMQLHRLIHIGKWTKIFRQVTLQVKKTIGSGRTFALLLPRKKDRFHRIRVQLPHPWWLLVPVLQVICSVIFKANLLNLLRLAF